MKQLTQCKYRSLLGGSPKDRSVKHFVVANNWHLAQLIINKYPWLYKIGHLGLRPSCVFL